MIDTIVVKEFDTHGNVSAKYFVNFRMYIFKLKYRLVMRKCAFPAGFYLLLYFRLECE